MNKEIKSALDELCKEILKSDNSEINQLVSWSRELYENLVIISYLESKKTETEDRAIEFRENEETEIPGLSVDTLDVNTTNNFIPKKLQPIEPDEADKEIKIYQNNEKQEDNVISIAQRKLEIKEEKIYVDTQSQDSLTTERKIFEKVEKSFSETTTGLNDRFALASKIILGLNDKIAFSKHLFLGDEQKMMKLVYQINQAGSFEEAINLLHQARADYIHWEEKKEYLTRLENLIRRRFGKPEIVED